MKPTSHQRTLSLRQPAGPGRNGRPLCTWCHKEVPKGRISWCSQQCVDAYTIRSWPHAARRRVEERDKGICAECGKDSNRIGRVMSALRRRARAEFSKTLAPRRSRFFIALTEGPQAPYRAWRKFRDHNWEADHIKPVSEGGADLGLENLRTLCLACHHRATAALAYRRSRAGRNETDLLAGEVAA